MSDAAAEHLEPHFTDLEHQSDAALSGMWLFLATELLFFGALFLIYALYRHFHPQGFAEASRHAELWIGTVNTVLLVSSSAVFAYALLCARLGDNPGVFRACLVTALLGALFLGLKGFEWYDDFGKHLFPGPDFAITGPDAGGAQLFYSFYFIATGLHGLHMLIGMGLLAYVAWQARRGTYSPAYVTPVEAVGLYWSFVDIVWLLLYPCIYLAGHVAA